MAVLPNWLYEPLPYVYAGAGLIATVSLDTITGRFSGILLITAGIVVGYQRFEHRRLLKERQERQAWLQEQAQKRKIQKQIWLREQAQKYREEIERKEEDF